MKNIFRIAFSYLKYYKKQTAALLLGILLSAALLNGMGGLLHSGKMAALDHARDIYGDWHYVIRCDNAAPAEYQKSVSGKGYQLENSGTLVIRKELEEPFSIQLVYADQGYLDMMERTLVKGHYPEEENEIALDQTTLKNLGLDERVGQSVTFGTDTFTIVGIMTDMPDRLPEFMGDMQQVFVNSTLDYGENGNYFYLKFRENKKVFRQMESFCRQLGISLKKVYRNNGIAGYVGGEADAAIIGTIKEGFSSPAAGLPYVWGQLNQNGRLTTAVILAAMAFFGAFIIYSLFRVSVIRRMSEYSILQTVGMTDAAHMGLLLCELGMIIFVGYPVGAVLGNLVSWLIYQKMGRIFIMQDSLHHKGVLDDSQKYAVSSLPDASSYQIDCWICFIGLIFFVIVILVISIVLLRQMKRLTIRQMVYKEIKHRKRKAYSIKQSNLTGILTHKFMFAGKGTFIGILFSLSIGSILFLGTFYMTENTKRNNELMFKADDGLGSDIQIYEQSDELKDTISVRKAERMKSISGVCEFHPVRYLLGEIELKDNTFLWPEFFADIANDENNPPDPLMQEKYNGIAVKTGPEDYTLKVNIYGYDDAMLEELNSYLLEGKINPGEMRKNNSVILKTIMDGQGNYDGIAIAPEDMVALKTPSSADIPPEALRFLGKEQWYARKELMVTALVSRPLAKVDTFIGDEGTTEVDIIMTNEQMEQNFGVTDYETISISVDEQADASAVSLELVKIASGIKKCIVKDYSGQIKAQNLYLTQKMVFYYGIAAVLLGISLLHIMNSMNYLVAARKHEFGILRAMGITDSGFLKMMAKEGLRYGIYSGAVVFILYIIVQKIMYYFMVHIYLYLHPQEFISMAVLPAVLLFNVALCTVVTLLSSGGILKQQIITEIGAS